MDNPQIIVVPQLRHCRRYKQSHASFEHALAHARHLRWLDFERGRDQAGRQVVIYYCLLHSAWHVGHQRAGVPLAH